MASFHALVAFQRCQVRVEKKAILHGNLTELLMDFLRVFAFDRHTPWFPLESLQIELDFRRSKILLKNHLNSWIATINILNTNLLPRVYNIINILKDKC
jgi:hypothetical protein